MEFADTNISGSRPPMTTDNAFPIIKKFKLSAIPETDKSRLIAKYVKSIRNAIRKQISR